MSNLPVAELRSLQDSIKHELKKREQQEVDVKARTQILAIAQSVGVPLKDLMAAGVRAKTGPVPVQYRNPADATQQRTGRGRQPKWIKELVGSGKSLDSVRV